MIGLVPMSRECLVALGDGDLLLAGNLCELSLPDAFLDERHVWGYFAGKLEADPRIENWLVNAVVRTDQVVVGHAGFHGPPDESGTVEIGYTTLEEHRGHGVAKAAVGLLVDRSVGEHEVRTIRANVAQVNTASQAVLAPHGFVLIGEAPERNEGTELIFERPA